LPDRKDRFRAAAALPPPAVSHPGFTFSIAFASNSKSFLWRD